MKHQMSKPVHPEVRIGHVHLKVADLERALAFYRDVLGFELTQRFGPRLGRGRRAGRSRPDHPAELAVPRHARR